MSWEGHCRQREQRGREEDVSCWREERVEEVGSQAIGESCGQIMKVPL